MTMIDEGKLTDALHDVANAFEISKDATDRIVAESRSAAPKPRSFHTPAFVPQPGRNRNILVAAALILVVGGISLPLLRSENSPTKSASPSHGLVAGAPARVVNGAGTQGGTSSPSLGALTPTAIATNSKTSVIGKRLNAAATNLSPKIESTGSVNLTVSRGKIEPALSTLSVLVTGDGGFVYSTQANLGSRATNNFSYGTIVLQVPQRTFTTLITQVQRVGHVTSVSTSSTDVTGQYVDLRARITAFEASRQQYLIIMTRATSIGDILAVQSQLNTLQSQIDQLQGQLNVLNNETTYGTLTVMLTEAGHPFNAPHKSSGLEKAWHDAVNGFVSGFEWLIRVSGPALFALLMLGVLLALGRFTWRAARRRRM